MAELLRKGKQAEEVMKVIAAKKKGDEGISMKPGRNEPCFCGSGQKFKNCHGKAVIETDFQKNMKT
jgi:preprotein translocase subunit SecA